MSKKVLFYTLGCKVNQYETAAMEELFSAGNYEVVRGKQKSPADVVVINTCAVTAESVRKSRQIIRKLRAANPKAILAVVGCFSKYSPEEAGTINGVDVVLGTDDRDEIVHAVERVASDRRNNNNDSTQAGHPRQAGNTRHTGHTSHPRQAGHIGHTRHTGHIGQKYMEFGVVPEMERTRAYVKIQDGCDNFCSFCIVPHIRGCSRSREEDEVIGEARALIERGYREIVLTGIQISSYSYKLDSLVLRLSRISGIERLRLGSLEPTIITPDFVKNMKECEPALCPHFHLSLQSGSSAVLKMMNRKYTPDEYLKSISLIRDSFPDASITTDIIVGFPGETEEEFSESFKFCEKVGFLKIHVFKYSAREGTPAAGYENQILPSVKERRSKNMIALSDRMGKDFCEKYVGREVSIIVEKASVIGERASVKGESASTIPERASSLSEHLPVIVCEGLTPNYMRVVAEVDGVGADKAEEFEGKMIEVLIKGYEGGVLKGVCSSFSNNLHSADLLIMR